MDVGFGPNERFAAFIIGFYERIDVLSQLFDRGEEAP